MTDQKTATIRAVLAKWMEDRVAIGRKVLNADVLEFMDVGDRKKATLNGRVIGSVTVADPKWTPKVTDAKALLEWAKTNQPHNVVTETVTNTSLYPSAAAAILASVEQVDGDTAAIHAESGEVIPGITYTRKDPYVTVTISKPEREALEAAYEAGELAPFAGAVLTTEPKEIESA